ncbi:hypothetical protein Lal_00008414, partial [Lupinus albus]
SSSLLCSLSIPLLPTLRFQSEIDFTLPFTAMSFESRSLFFFFFLFFTFVFASESDHKYQQDDPVTLWVNKVGPYNNPQETYNYYSLPFCHPSSSAEAAHKWGGLGEVLGGNELIDSQVEIKFLRNVDKTVFCQVVLDDAKVKQFKDAIENNYWFEFFVDDLPLWGMSRTASFLFDMVLHFIFYH